MISIFFCERTNKPKEKQNRKRNRFVRQTKQRKAKFSRQRAFYRLQLVVHTTPLPALPPCSRPTPPTFLMAPPKQQWRATVNSDSFDNGLSSRTTRSGKAKQISCIGWFLLRSQLLSRKRLSLDFLSTTFVKFRSCLMICS